MAGTVDTSVNVYIYDLSKGLARQFSPMLLGKQLEGIWHTAIVAFGQEFFYGSNGIESCAPKHTILGEPDKAILLGHTEIPFELIMEHLQELSQSKFRPEKYHLLEHNCNTFSSDFAQFLTGNDIPTYITNLPSEVLSTPFGAMIKPFIDSMSVSPGGSESHVISQRNGQIPSSSSTVPSFTPAHTPAFTPVSTSTHGTTTPSTTSSAPVSNQGPPVVRPATQTDGDFNEAGTSTVTCGCSVAQDSFVILTSVLTDSSSIVSDLSKYILTSPTTWSIGREHIHFLVKVILDETSLEEARCISMKCLQKLVLDSNVTGMLRHGANLDLEALCRCNIPEAIHSNRLALLCNICRSVRGSQNLVERGDSVVDLVQNLCNSGLLEGTNNMQHTAASLALNLSLQPMAIEPMGLSLACALIEALNFSDLSEETAFLMMSALSNLVQQNSEIKDLLAVMEDRWTRHKYRSTRLENCCSKLT